MITLSKKHKRKKKHGGDRYASILTYEQRQKFDDIGIPDPTQNWLEIFTPDLMSDLRTIMRSCSDNQLKSDYVTRELHAYGFEDVGLGTNIVTMANPLYPGVVFKIALDDYGIADNFNDCVLQDVVPKYNRVLTRDPSAMISVQERQVLMTPAQRELFMPKILDLLSELKRYFLIADLSPDMYLNYGITREGDFRIIDGSDLYPLHQLKDEPRCTRLIGEGKKHAGKFKYCEGKLKYTSDYKWLVCQKCGREYNPLEFRPRKDVEKMQRILSDGLSVEERDRLEQEEIEAVLRAQGIERVKPSKPVDVDEDPIDNEPEEVSFEEFVKTASEDLNEPRVIFVKPDAAEEDRNTKRSPANGSGIAVGGSVGTSDLHGKGEPEDSKESLQSDESGELEAADLDQDDADDEAEMPTELRKKSIVNSQEDSQEASDQEDETLESAVTRLITSIRGLKFSQVEEEQEQFRRLMNAVFEEEFAAADEADADEEEDVEEDQHPELADMTQQLSGEELIRIINDLSISSSPSDQKIYQELMDKFGGEPPDVQNEVSDKVIYQKEVQEDSSVPHITYSVINETSATDEDVSLTPGIYLDVYGDFDEAYEASGLSIWVTLNGEPRMDKAIDAYKLGPAIKRCVDDILAEQAMVAARRKEASEPEVDEDDSEDEDTDSEN